MLLQDPQQLALEGQSQSSNLIEKQGSAVRRFDMTGACFMCIRERPLFVAKQLRLDQAFRKSRTVYADKGLVAPRAGGDDGLRRQFFPGSTLSCHQYRGVNVSNAIYQMMNLLHRDPFAKSEDPDDQATAYSGKLLPPGSQYYSKAGWTSDTRHDTAYIRLPNGAAYILAVFTVDNSKQTEIIPFVSQRVAQEFLKAQ